MVSPSPGGDFMADILLERAARENNPGRYGTCLVHDN
jgi:hypothetical protein